MRFIFLPLFIVFSCFVHGGYDCALYTTTCSGQSNFQLWNATNYTCAQWVTANAATLGANTGYGTTAYGSCREDHLARAQTNAAQHCPHAQRVATGPCASETLTTPTITTSSTPTNTTSSAAHVQWTGVAAVIVLAGATSQLIM